ncbi:hypothetical protein DPEC_G00272370 [Dallia pectoralis]|uniref:Uncharacterized protein n=1 Tax=Dallia pectoralis TaxID=75939 RepID=A0ACC2FQ80_DALPE|nr:hypothetical protein DPEC_G00272370 [Dallia pectoralis]
MERQQKLLVSSTTLNIMRQHLCSPSIVPGGGQPRVSDILSHASKLPLRMKTFQPSPANFPRKFNFSRGTDCDGSTAETRTVSVSACIAALRQNRRTLSAG